jgi:outer membrane protein TolC
MKTDARALITAALLVAAAAGAGAQAARIVDLQECIRLAIAGDAGLRVGELDEKIADARLREMQGQYYPSVTLQGSYSRLSDVSPGIIPVQIPPFPPSNVTLPAPLDNSTSIRLGIQQPLFTGLRIADSIRQAQSQREANRGDLAKSRIDLRYLVEETFWDLAKAKTQEQAIRESVEQLQGHLADVRTLLSQGMATNNDVLQAQMRLEDAQIDLGSALSFREITRVRLAQLLDLPWNAPLDIADVDTSAAVPPPPATEELVTRALAARPDIRGSRARVDAQEAAIGVARAGLFPSVSLTGDYTIANPNQRIFPQTDQFVGTWSVGVLGSIDVGRYPQVLAQQEQARDRLAQARESSRKLLDTVSAEVVRAALGLREASDRLDALRRETVQARENDRVTQERYRQGIALSSESLDAQTLLVRARLREAGAFFDCLIAQAALQKAIGE